MKIAVWDTYVQRKKTLENRTGPLMHFDILVPEGTTFTAVQAYGHAYLTEKNEAGQSLSTKECQFCHIEAATPDVEAVIKSQGFAIIEMDGCEL